MERLKQVTHNRELRKRRVRAVVSGTPERPRLSVAISNRHVTAQLIDDTNHHTLAYVTTAGKKDLKGALSERAAWAGSEIAKKARGLHIKSVVFDRSYKQYHGRVKLLADTARENGLEF